MGRFGGSVKLFCSSLCFVLYAKCSFVFDCLCQVISCFLVLIGCAFICIKRVVLLVAFCVLCFVYFVAGRVGGCHVLTCCARRGQVMYLLKLCLILSHGYPCAYQSVIHSCVHLPLHQHPPWLRAICALEIAVVRYCQACSLAFMSFGRIPLYGGILNFVGHGLFPCTKSVSIAAGWIVMFWFFVVMSMSSHCTWVGPKFCFSKETFVMVVKCVC